METQKSNTMRSLLITTLVVVVVVGIGFLFGGSRNKEQSTASLIDGLGEETEMNSAALMPAGSDDEIGGAGAPTRLSILAPGAGEAISVGATYEVRWTGGDANVNITLVPTLQSDVTPEGARNANAIETWEALVNTGSARITIPSIASGSYQFIVSDEFGAAVSVPFTVSS